MRSQSVIMLDRPETNTIAMGIGYNVLAFWSLPFVFLLLMQGSFDDEAVISGIEIAYHIFNFVAAFFIFRRYLMESFINVQINVKGFVTTVFACAGVIMLVAVVLFYACMFLPAEVAALGAFGILPLAEMDLFTVSSSLITMRPILGTVCVIFLAPFTTSCLYYATVFAPIACNRPWLAYLAMAGCIAIPRICNALTYWPPEEELVLFVVQLPVHLIACWSYKKTDTVWAPIAVHTLVNALSCAALLIMQYLM